MQQFLVKCCIFLYILKFYPQKNSIPLVLRDSQISFRDIIGRVIENIHKQCRLHALFPGVIAEGFAQSAIQA